MSDPHRIETEDQLREVIGNPSDRVREKVFDRVDPIGRAFVERSPLVLVATCSADGHMDVSPKGDTPGFVAVEDERTLLIPDRSGNNLVYGHLNLLANPRIGLIFLIPGTRETYRVNGSAELTRDPTVLAALPARGRPALLATRVRVEEAFIHCGKAMIRSALWKPETWPEDFRPQVGRMLARKLGAGDEVADAIDEALERDYVEGL